jgi:hypothetical protein
MPTLQYEKLNEKCHSETLKHGFEDIFTIN